MKKSFNVFAHDPICLGGLLLSLIFLVSGVIFIFFSWNYLPPQIPLFYNQLWGEQQLGEKRQILFLPLFAFLIFLFDFFTSVKFIQKEPLLARILMGTGVILVLVLMIALFQIVNLIT